VAVNVPCCNEQFRPLIQGKTLQSLELVSGYEACYERAIISDNLNLKPMNTANHQSETRRLSLDQVEAVRSELRSILTSSHFSSSKRCQDLLEFVVETALAGEFDSLTERFIGAKVFGRPIEYETATDAIVRVRANDARRRLGQFYSEAHSASTARILLHSGSYVPEFQVHTAPAAKSPAPGEAAESAGENATTTALTATPAALAAAAPFPAQTAKRNRKRWIGLSAALAILIAFALLAVWQLSPQAPLDSFWAPLVQEKTDILLCAGGNTFQQGPVPGFITAGKEIDYPYFSLQTEISTTLLSALLERKSVPSQFRFAASTPLTEFHEHPLILLNAYNNQWTLRLTAALPVRFNSTGSRPQAIFFAQEPDKHWSRDANQPYENSDDYALLARFWDTTTDNWVLVLAGLGRNGTEGATRFVTDAHYMQELRNRLGRDFNHLNIEVVLKVSVVDGKTGAPEIVATHVW